MARAGSGEMTPEPFWSLAIELPRRHLAWLAQRLAAAGYASFEEQQAAAGVRVVVYATNPAALEALGAQLAPGSPGIPPEKLHFTLAEVPSGWALEWTKHLTPVALTPAVTLYPSRPAGVPGPGELYIEPAFAFGFGEHASTRLCARWLEASCASAPGVSVLDVGCGTGVLALLAAKSGAGRVLGIDLSEPAVAAARANALSNHLGVAFERTALESVGGCFDRVVANIEAGILCQLASGVAERLGPRGELALAGLISEQCDAVVRRYNDVGVTLALTESVDDWCLLTGSRSG